MNSKQHNQRLDDFILNKSIIYSKLFVVGKRVHYKKDSADTAVIVEKRKFSVTLEHSSGIRFKVAGRYLENAL